MFLYSFTMGDVMHNFLVVWSCRDESSVVSAANMVDALERVYVDDSMGKPLAVILLDGVELVLRSLRHDAAIYGWHVDD